MAEPQRTAVLVPALEQDSARPITMSHWRVKVGQRVEIGGGLVDITFDKAGLLMTGDLRCRACGGQV